jgi:hypothetical protein
VAIRATPLLDRPSTNLSEQGRRSNGSQGDDPEVEAFAVTEFVESILMGVKKQVSYAEPSHSVCMAMVIYDPGIDDPEVEAFVESILLGVKNQVWMRRLYADPSHGLVIHNLFTQHPVNMSARTYTSHQLTASALWVTDRR